MEFLKILLGHNLWATRMLLERSRELTPEQFHQRFEIGPGSVHDTLLHIIGPMRRWADRIAGRTLRDRIDTAGTRRSVDEMQALLEAADAELRDVAGELDARQGWNESMDFQTDDGAVYHFSRAAAMMHVATHGVHHRSQVLNMRRQLGLPPLGLDLDPIEWECAQNGQIAS